MATSPDGENLLRRLAAEADVDDVARRLVAEGIDPSVLADVEAFVRALDRDPSLRDRALLLVERTRVLSERAGRGARDSDRLRGEASRERATDADPYEGPAGVWRHELATPLAVVDLALGTLAAHVADPEVVTQMLDVARRNLRVASHLLDGLGSLEDLRSGRVELSWEQVDLVELVHECVEDVRGVMAGRHEIAVSVEQSLDVPADRQAVRQILVNLLSNAAKFSPVESAIALTVSATRRHVEVTVLDEGRGLSPHDAERIFEAGERLDVGTPGSGLGLFVARQLARAHGGELYVEHPAAGGARFVLRLPRSPAEWQRSLERREEAGVARDARQRQRAETADARDAALAGREVVADQRDAALTDREAVAHEQDAERARREGA